MSVDTTIYFYISTLKRRYDRTISSVATLRAVGVPWEQIVMHMGKDGHEYESQEVMYNAFIDVYPQMAEIKSDSEWETTKVEKVRLWGRGDIGCLWSTLECLDRFIESDHEIGYFTQDDRVAFPTELAKRGDYYRDRRAWPDLQYQVYRLWKEDPDAMCFHTFYHPEHAYRKHNENITFERIVKTLPICKGFVNRGDSGIVFSKAGAEELKRYIFTNKVHLEHAISHVGYREHYYCTLTPNRFMGDVDPRIYYFGDFVEGDIDEPEIGVADVKSIGVQDRVILNYEDKQKDPDRIFMPSDQRAHIEKYNAKVQAFDKTFQYIVCSTPRSGTGLLRYLLDCCQLGYPHETRYNQYLYESHYADTLFQSLTLWPTRLDALLRKISKKECVDNSEIESILLSKYPDIKFIHLNRIDKIAQAVSMVKAQLTDNWHGRKEHTHRVWYNFDKIQYWVDRFNQDEVAWQDIFNSVSEIPVLSITYDDVASDANRTLNKIGKHLGVSTEHITDELLAELRSQDTFPVQQSDEINEEWIRRFKVDSTT